MQAFCATSSSPPMSIIFLITKDQRRGANSRRVLRRSEGSDRCPLAGEEEVVAPGSRASCQRRRWLVHS